MFVNLIKDVIKDTDKMSDEEIYRAKSGRVLTASTFVPLKLG